VPDKVKIFLIYAAVLIGIGFIGYVIEGSNSTPAQPMDYKHSLNIVRATATARSLKKAMRDPDSFKLSIVRIVDKTDAICYEYRARNGFGGLDIGQAVVSPKGTFRTNEMDGFNSLWNRECAHQQGTDEVDTVSYMLNH
jgi:hypothetical protein